MTTITAGRTTAFNSTELGRPARRSCRHAGMSYRTQPTAVAPRHKVRPVGVVTLVLAGLLIYGASRAFTDVKAATEPAHDGPAYFVVMPHPASEENRRVAQWLSRRLDCPIVEDASVHKVGVRGGAR